MPYKFIDKKLLIPQEHKRSCKLTIDQKEQVREDYKTLKSQRQLAKKYNVSRRLIQFILNPDMAQRNKELFQQRQPLYYDKNKHKNYIKKHRHYKQALYKKGLLMENKP